jgi:hypothetical protein
VSPTIAREVGPLTLLWACFRESQALKVKCSLVVSTHQMHNFGENTDKELHNQLTELLKQSSGIILDLRNNTGGYLDTAVQLLQNF